MTHPRTRGGPRWLLPALCVAAAASAAVAVAVFAAPSEHPQPEPPGPFPAKMFACYPSPGAVEIPVYAEASTDSAVVDLLAVGDSVTVLHISASDWASVEGLTAVFYAQRRTLSADPCDPPGDD